MAKATSTLAPQSLLDPVKRDLSEAKKTEIEESLDQAIGSALADRANLETKLVYWNQLYEQDLGERDSPWTDAANLNSPIVVTYLDTLVAQLAAMVYVERFFVVTGNSEEASKVAPDVERFYNQEMWRYNWPDAFYTCLGLAARDGVGIMEVVWDRTVRREKFLQMVPRTQHTPFGDINALDNNGQTVLDAVEQEIEHIEYDNVRLNPVELRDFILSPQWATSIEAAQGVGRAMYFTEDELKKMVAGGELFRERTEQAINYTSTTASDLASDEVSTDTYQAAGSISIGSEQGALVVDGEVRMPTARILKVWRYHTRQFDLDGDGVAEENVMFYHRPSRKFIGYFPFPYWIMKRPFMGLTLMPRFNRFLGFSIPERLQFVYTEDTANKNQRVDAIDLRILPPSYQTMNAKPMTEGKEWGPGARWELDNEKDFGLITLPEIPQSAFLMHNEIMQDAQMLMGFSSPTTGQLSKERRSKYEMQVAAQSTSIRLGHMAQLLRTFAKGVLVYANALKVQYGPDQSSVTYDVNGVPKQATITKDMLGQDLSFDVSGSITGPDKQAREDKAIYLYQTLGQDPDIVGNPQHKYALVRNLLVSMGVDNVVDIIGTEQEFIQQRQQMQQAQMGAQMGGQQPGGGPPQGGKPGGPPQGGAP